MKTTLAREGILFLAVVILLFLGTAMRQVNLLLLLTSLLCCALLIAWRLGRNSIAFMEVRRFVPPQIHAGEVFMITFDLWNPLKKHGALAVVVEDTLRFCDEEGRLSKPMRPAVYFEHVPPEKHGKKNYAGILPRRGRYLLGPLTISTRFPFGLYRTSRVIPSGATRSTPPAEVRETIPVIVFPRLGKLSARWRTRQHEAMESRHRRRFRPSRVGGEFLALRGWQQGDLRRWIHWRASARHRTLVVRQFEQHRNRDATILLDLYRPGASSRQQQENVELAVSLAATLVREMSRQAAAGPSLAFYGARFPVERSVSAGAAGVARSENLVSGEETCEILSGTTCAPLIDSMLAALALLEPGKKDRLSELLGRAITHVDSRGDIFLITTGPLDLMETARLEKLRSDPRFRPFAARIRVLDTSDSRLGEIFTLD